MPKGQHLKVDNPRNNTLSFKVTNDELITIQSLARVEGLSISEYVRKTAIDRNYE